MKQRMTGHSIQVEERHNLALLLGFTAGLQQQPAVVEGKADDLLHPLHNVLIAQPAIAEQHMLNMLRPVVSTLNILAGGHHAIWGCTFLLLAHCCQALA